MISKRIAEPLHKARPIGSMTTRLAGTFPALAAAVALALFLSAGVISAQTTENPTTQSLCESGDAVPDAGNNAGLVADCVALLDAKSALAGTGTLNWSSDTAIASWDGVNVGGKPARVTQLHLAKRDLTGTIPTELGDLSGLKRLVLNRNQLTGGIPTQLGGLSKLEALWLQHNQLTGAIPTELGNLSKLKELRLQHNQLTGSIPTSFGERTGSESDGFTIKLSDLEQLRLDNNQLTGAIPGSLSGLKKLKELRLDNNKLTGEIPLVLKFLPQLEKLSLANNQLTGDVPSELGGLSNLEELTLAHNQLIGRIPRELGQLSSLMALELNHNDLKGPIPTQLGSLTNLVELRLNGNSLSGCVPTAIRSFSNLTKPPAADLAENMGLWWCDYTAPETAPLKEQCAVNGAVPNDTIEPEGLIADCVALLKFKAGCPIPFR